MALFTILATGVADSVENRRPGARHAMLIFVTAEDFEAGQAKAAGVALGTGWMMVRLEKGMETDPARLPDDPILADAAQTALVEGSAMVVYGDELPAEA
jgi:hypothetical protein